ncbi:MAG TPA: hypothetical protein VKA01_12715 [Vicinamibacteria bacterium]|nr:hypothetical protein [Vicinamibacteria bacterium]
MRASQGYDPAATTNGARFQSEVLRHLARQALAQGPPHDPLLIGHAEWFRAVLERTTLTPAESPAFIRLGHEHEQDIFLEYGNDRVIRRVLQGESPALALSVSIGWGERHDAPKSYSYEDTLSTPKLKVTNKRVIRYRLLDFGDMVVFDEVAGLQGRPTSGVLGLLFQLIGEGHVVENRMVISSDGLQIARARVTKAFFHVEATVTVHPNGRTEKDLPPGRMDLAPLETRLKKAFRLEYLPATNWLE